MVRTPETHNDDEFFQMAPRIPLVRGEYFTWQAFCFVKLRSRF
jgi:hypothetical protein